MSTPNYHIAAPDVFILANTLIKLLTQIRQSGFEDEGNAHLQRLQELQELFNSLIEDMRFEKLGDQAIGDQALITEVSPKLLRELKNAADSMHELISVVPHANEALQACANHTKTELNAVFQRVRHRPVLMAKMDALIELIEQALPDLDKESAKVFDTLKAEIQRELRRIPAYHAAFQLRLVADKIYGLTDVALRMSGENASDRMHSDQLKHLQEYCDMLNTIAGELSSQRNRA